jgi:hypothetical protein
MNHVHDSTDLDLEPVIKNWRNTLERLQTQMISSQHQLLHGSTPLGLADDHLVIGPANAGMWSWWPIV